MCNTNSETPFLSETVQNQREENGNKAFSEYIESNQILNKNYQQLSSSFKKIFHILLNPIPTKRSNVNEILNLPYFKVFHQHLDNDKPY